MILSLNPLHDLCEDYMYYVMNPIGSAVITVTTYIIELVTTPLESRGFVFKGAEKG